MSKTLRRCPTLLVAFGLVLGGSLSHDLRAASAQAPAQPVEFNRDVRPILAEACGACHGASEVTRQADLRLDTRDFIGSVVVPGDADGSTLFQRLTSEDRVIRMPPVSSGRTLAVF